VTERLADVATKIRGVRQLGAIVVAMRGMAASRAQQGRALLDGIAGSSL
jgi:F-type H+-transporting ATPase subunit gamma